MSAALPLLLCLLHCAPAPQSAGAAPAQQIPVPAYDSVLLDDIPHVRQQPDFCGEACAEMALRRLGHDLDQGAVFGLTGVDPALGRGAWTRELKRALERLGFMVGPVWSEGPQDHDPAFAEAQWAALHADLLAGHPSIVCMHYDESPHTTEHFRLALGYDAASDELIYHEPAEDGGAFSRMDRALFMRLWPLSTRAGRQSFIRLRLQPGKMELPLAEEGHSRAALAQHVRALKKKLPAGFTVVVEPPFVVIGDDEPARVQARAEGTVRWAVRLLRQDYFQVEPAEIYDIWLFKDDSSYRHHARVLFGDQPDTPYGYASQADHALVMNIATGGGTLVHEIVHAFMYADFPSAPSWFDEGLASLYERCSERDGHMVGHTNWRLEGLQRAIEADALPSFRWLMERSERQFYGEDPGTNYAQSRYLCQYLQERGKLIRYYQRFKAVQERDPSGYQTLRQVLGIEDMAAFTEDWKAWVMELEES